MALPLRSALALFLLFLIAIPYVHASEKHGDSKDREGVGKTKKKSNKNQAGSGSGSWKGAHATFYEGGPRSFGGACGYEDVNEEGYGLDTAALSTVLFKDGKACGACFELKCVDSPKWCKPDKSTLTVTATDLCPLNLNQPSDNGGWCNPPREHFDLAKPAYLKIAKAEGGIVPIQYRRVPCKRQGGIRFTITGNPYFNLVRICNVGGAGDIVSVQVKGDNELQWTDLKRNWGQKWETNAKLVGESLTFKVKTSDGKISTSTGVTPKNWQFGQTFEGKNFS